MNRLSVFTFVASFVLAQEAFVTQAAAAQSPAVDTTSQSESKESAAIGLGIAAKVGAIIPTSKLNATYAIALDLSYQLPLHLPLPKAALFLAGELSYAQPKYSGSRNEAAVGGNYSYDLQQRLVTGSIDALLKMPIGPLSVYGGPGYGVYFLRAQMKAFDSTTHETQIRAGLQLRAGGAYAVGPGDLFAELRYHYVGLRFLGTGRANAGGVTISAGYRVFF